MKQTGDLNLVKKINKSLVLDYLRYHSPISRSHIAELTGLTKATVSNLVNECIDDQLAYEVGAGESSGGRKPMMLLFHHQAGYAIGVDLGVNYILAALTDLQGTLVEEYRISHHNVSLHAVMTDLYAVIREMIRRTPPSPYGVIGIGIGIPGICDEQGTVLFAPHLGWKNIPLQQWIEDEFRLPVVIDNEANAGARGEQQFSIGKDVEHLIYLSMSMGIGSGLMIKGELYRGVSGFSGELGHMSIMYDGATCRCGNSGCWELYASEQALLRDAKQAFAGQSVLIPVPSMSNVHNATECEPTSLESLLFLAEQGNHTAIDLFHQLGRFMGIGLVSVIHGFNPQYIIIGGRLAAAQVWLTSSMNEVIESRSMSYPRSQLSVQFSQLNARSTLLGACSFVITKFFASTKITRE